MADPLWLADELRKEGVAVVEYPAWKDRGHGDFGTIWGVVAHHTGGNPPGNNPGNIANHPTLGLCSQIHLSRTGVATVVGAGIANHAGRGSWPGISENNANAVTIGVEAENNGTEGWTPAQYDAYVRICAAICRKIGQPASHVIAHWEWAGAAQGKWDPGGLDMDKFRADIQARLNNKPEEGDMDFAAFKTYMDAVVSDVKDIREQLCGAGQRDAGQFKGWPQLGGKTVVDALADIQSRLAKLEGK
ncbi:hypothetical protein B2J88_08100 [Rhodococcus sp. SRB_17]|nr:hypothetical protein [Rhodococcus sp. SRB_17]